MFEKYTHTHKRFPFDSKNPIGYLIAVSVQAQVILVQLRHIQCFLTLGFAGLLFAFSIVEDIKDNLNEFNKMAKTRRSQSSKTMEQLTKIICYHINLRELSSLGCINFN